MFKEIPVKNGHTIVDDCDAGILFEHAWRKNSDGYIIRTCPRDGGPRKISLLHREIISAKQGESVDHINGVTWDNRRQNLRICTHQENVRNQRTNSKNTSGYKGVFWHAKAGKWCVHIRKNGKGKHVGLFEKAHDAARAYNVAAQVEYGEFARLNVIPRAIVVGRFGPLTRANI